MEEYDYLSQEKFDKVKAKLQQMIDDGWEVPKMVACIYDLFQEYIISETQEQILYQMYILTRTLLYSDVRSNL